MREQCFPDIGRCVSIFDRLMKMYYDHGLSDFEIGWGQQFYVEYLYEHPGATPQEMTDRFRVDKATLSKTIRKLSEVKYIRVEGDEKDRRVKHLYLTEKAIPRRGGSNRYTPSSMIHSAQRLTQEELESAEQILLKMADNINQKVWHRMEAHHEQ